jgi:CheY-like chemotaxis protein
VRSCLNGITFEVLIAADGKEAIELAGNHNGTIDLFLTDVDMPFIDAVATYREIKMQRPGIGVLFMAGGAVPPDLPEHPSVPTSMRHF